MYTTTATHLNECVALFVIDLDGYHRVRPLNACRIVVHGPSFLTHLTVEEVSYIHLASLIGDVADVQATCLTCVSSCVPTASSAAIMMHSPECSKRWTVSTPKVDFGQRSTMSHRSISGHRASLTRQIENTCREMCQSARRTTRWGKPGDGNFSKGRKVRGKVVTKVPVILA